MEIPKGSNWGPAIKKYLASVKINFPAFWCMAFVVWCVAQASHQQGVKSQLYPTGGVREQWQKCKPLRVDLKKDRPRAGDIFIILQGGVSHCGFVEYVVGDRIYTIEGNSNQDGSDNGYEVCRKPGGRPISSITGFIRVAFE